MRCRFCGCRCVEERMPRDWKVCGEVAVCGACRPARCRVRTITAAVADLAGATWREFSAVLKHGPEPLLIRDPERIQLTTLTSHPAVRVSLADRWWTLRLNSRGWSAGRRSDWQLLSSEALALEVQIDRKPSDTIACRIIAWLSVRRVMVSPFDSDIPASQNIASMELNKLRRAIRSNRVSFPAQLPDFPGAARDTELQRRAAQLYFVLGWSCTGIAARYNLLPREARHMIMAWKQRAVNAGYIQRIPPPAVFGPPDAGGDIDPPAPGAARDSTPEDAHLIAGLRAGNAASYERLLARYQDRVYNLASRLLCDRAHADDVTVAVFLRAFRDTGHVCARSSLRVWLYRFVVAECGKHSFRQTPHPALSSAVPIERALLEIDPPLRAPLVLRGIENLSYEDIADILQLPVTTVRHRIELAWDLIGRNPITAAAPQSKTIANLAAHPAA